MTLLVDDVNHNSTPKFPVLFPNTGVSSDHLLSIKKIIENGMRTIFNISDCCASPLQNLDNKWNRGRLVRCLDVLLAGLLSFTA